MPAVSVIIPNYNHAPFLRQRIDSVLGQSFTDIEIILLDDCSSDKSRNVIEGYRAHPLVTHIVFNERNSGSTFRQWEKGLALSKGEYVWIAESDDWAHPEFLATIVPLLRDDKKVMIGYCMSAITDELGTINGTYLPYLHPYRIEVWSNDFKMEGKHFLEEFLSKLNAIPNSSAVVFRKEALSGVTIDKQMRYCGDWKLWWDILLKGDIVYVAAEMNYYRWHANTVTKLIVSKELFEKERMALVRYFYQSALRIGKRKELLEIYYRDLYRQVQLSPVKIFMAMGRIFVDLPLILRVLLASKTG